ncbi:MAG: AAA family ATPase, partial [Bacteroidota bacterium]
MLALFPASSSFESLKATLQQGMEALLEDQGLFAGIDHALAAEYLLNQLGEGTAFVISSRARELAEAFLAQLKKQKATQQFRKSFADLGGSARLSLLYHWVQAFLQQTEQGDELSYALEICALLDGPKIDPKQVVSVSLREEITGLRGEHQLIKQGVYTLDYHGYMERMRAFVGEVRPMYLAFGERKKQLLEAYREDIRLESFQPRVLSSFVRNQLIDEVYLPLIGDNLAKQIGTVGEETRTDRMGMLLLISPPGYGKTTLMEYIANRLGLIFMKVNGPAIGHDVRSIDPQEAPNAAAREELQKLNLALEMGDNIMLYVDDIQHCHPEFLQKFISLCDAQRKMEGVYRGRTRTYDLRGKRVAVVMAGNPYTESGEQFQIPDMLANRADTYNLGDIIGERDQAFKRSYIENALTSNAILARLSSAPKADVQALVQMAEGGEATSSFESRISPEEQEEYLNVLRKLLRVQEVILTVNQAYIHSAAQADRYRTEPPFQLQGSYRNMNRLAQLVQEMGRFAEGL